MTDHYPVVLLKNEATGRFHPMVYRLAPLPGGATLPSAERYKSIGHHTVGFATREAALEYVKDEAPEGTVWTGREVSWTGEGIPASVDFFTDAELGK